MKRIYKINFILLYSYNTYHMDNTHFISYFVSKHKSSLYNVYVFFSFLFNAVGTLFVFIISLFQVFEDLRFFVTLDMFRQVSTGFDLPNSRARISINSRIEIMKLHHWYRYSVVIRTSITPWSVWFFRYMIRA